VSETPGMTRSSDGTSIAWFRSGTGPPIVLVHGATADHTAWRTVGPILSADHTLYAIDRRGRGASGDTEPYGIAREYEDVATVVDAVAAAEGAAVDVIGHSFGGRVGLGAALLTPNLRRLVVYEGAPAPDGRSFQGREVMARLEGRAAAGDRDGLLADFLGSVVGMTPEELGAYRASSTWTARVAAAPTLIREMRAEAAEEAGPERYAAIRIPVLQIAGGESNALFTDGTWALDRLLPNGRVVVIPGAKHAAHHTHPEAFLAAIREFLDSPLPFDHA
jgi:pimeloyl-ACP methyl ester carboxylesterase